MVVLARKKHEAILIDGLIRIEVVNVGKATVRVRLRAPRRPASPPRPGSTFRENVPGEASPAHVVPVGIDDFLMTLVNQQVVNLGESITLAVVDADKSRALFFIDAPLGMSVTALKHEGDDRPRSSTRQALLQFMGQPEDPSTPDIQPAPQNQHTAGRTTSADLEPEPKLLPFPTRMPKRHRL
ncbi:MAG: carbon storage regulator [Isosphaeraceae bacterium]